MQAPKPQNKSWGDAEIHEIGQAVEFRAEARGAFEDAREPPIDFVENSGEYDGRERKVVTALRRNADRCEPGAQREQGDDIRLERANGDRLKTATARLFRLVGIERWKQRHGEDIARRRASGYAGGVSSMVPFGLIASIALGR